MANILTNEGKERLLTGDIHWDTDTIRAQLVLGSPGSPLAANFDDIPAGYRTGSPVALTGKSFTNGVADAADAVVTAVPTPGGGSPIKQIIIYKDSGVESTSTVIAVLDTATGLPVTANGGDISMVWDSGSNKIFAL
jgi:hypothetical protein